jgi:hypothetical protein
MTAILKTYGPWIITLLAILTAIMTGLNPSVVRIPVPAPKSERTVYDTVTIQGRARVQLVHRLVPSSRDSGLAGPNANTIAPASPATSLMDSAEQTYADYDTDIVIPLGDSSWVKVAVTAVYCIETQMYKITASAIDWRLYAVCPGISDTWTWIERAISAALIIVSAIIK